MEQGNFGAHVLSDARGGVQGNRFPHGLYLLLIDVMRGEEPARGVRAIHLETTARWHPAADSP